jgi:hypothetical protein
VVSRDDPTGSIPGPGAPVTPARSSPGFSISGWLLNAAHESKHAAHPHTAPWWQVMCLTGVDYFSTLGYQPSIAFLAAGYLSPFATVVLVLLSLFGALPVYNRIAALSPNGQGSLSVLQERLPKWRGRDWSCACWDSRRRTSSSRLPVGGRRHGHIIENPFVPAWLNHRMGVTLLLVVLLGGIFLRGFREAIWLAVALVAAYLTLNACHQLRARPHRDASDVVSGWTHNLLRAAVQPMMMVAFSLLLFPSSRWACRIRDRRGGDAARDRHGSDDAARLASRIANTELLKTAAIIMSVLLIGSSLVTDDAGARRGDSQPRPGRRSRAVIPLRTGISASGSARCAMA